MIGVVVRKRGGYIHARGAASFQRRAVHAAARRVGGAVAPVAADAHERRVQAVQTARRRQRQLLIAPAEAPAAHMHHRLAAQYERAPSASRVRFRHRGEERAGLARLAVEPVGEQQRLMIAASLMSDKSVFIFDEPTSNLDADQLQAFVAQVIQLKEAGKAVLIISHDVELMAQVCDEVYHL